MTRDELTDVVHETLSGIAPVGDWADVDATADLREELDLDSMDLLNWTIALHRRLGVSIPEVDVPKLDTIEHAVDYLEGRL